MKKKLFTLFEILIWTVLLIIPALFLLTLLHPDLKVQKHYSVNFKDINGVIIGSPVNFIGYNIGYVRKINVKESDVNLDIAITQKDFKFPRCTVIKVEESGLGGSRSLEVFPCEEGVKQEGVYTQTPKRVVDILDDACEFVDGLNETMSNVYIMLYSFIGDKNHSKFENLQKNIIQTDKDLKQTSANLDKIQKNSDKNLKQAQANMKEALAFIRKIKFDPIKAKESTLQTERQVEKVNKEVSKISPAQWKENTKNFYIQSEIIEIKNKEQLNKMLKNINKKLNAATGVIDSINSNLQPDSLQDKTDKLEDIRNNTQELIKED